ncbi:hypothetical protein [Flavobacterium sp. N502540]|uniref:hypothetical protein n=1 Tax=Flavobacterium sp. N502540 TaxID=2986838 RepID=UPI0022250068|nr:hypothetical protein [Flavobacterium sp. N502540]
MNELYATCLIYDKTLEARIGGNPPKVIENDIPEDYNFYAVINHPEKQDKMLSIIIHNNFDVLLENNIYPDISVKVIEHEYSEIGDRKDKVIEDLGICSISNYSTENLSEFLFIKVGGEPRLIQPKSYFYEKLEKGGYSFFLQIEEEGYYDGMDYVFMYGALYLYKHNITGEIIAGFWQYS